MTVRRAALVLFLALAAGTAWGDYFIARARVVNVTPITENVVREAPRSCDAQRPGPDATLTGLLRWDLCPAERVVVPTTTGYRVSYEWDNRVYEQRMSSPPAGDTVPVRVSLSAPR